MPYDITLPVVQNRDLGGGNFLIQFEHAAIAEQMTAAQFFMIGIPGSETLLRRPYSVCGLPGTFEDSGAAALHVLYKVYGRGTALLASLRAGASIRVLGPLGRGFELPQSSQRRPLLVAGGIGSAPFPAWIQALQQHPLRPWMIYGARGAADLPLADWFEAHSEKLILATEDGSVGHRGRVTVPLAQLLDEHDPESLHLYACGPEPMLRAVGELAVARGVPCDLALEAHMACGFGVCLGCVVPTRDEKGQLGYERVCVEGPVMAAQRLLW